MTDEALMLAVKEGDLDRLSAIFERYHRPLFAFFYRMVGDRVAAEDLVQEVFVRVLKYRETFAARTSFKAWVYRIARNSAHDFARRRAETGDIADADEVAMCGPGPGRQFEQREDLALLAEALRRLPPDKRELVILARFRQMTYPELAVLMDADEGTIRVRLHRAIRQLSAIYDDLQRVRPNAV